ncbi:MAG: hypothetical protein P1V21_15360 [Rhizobiaceae bacterium]|nr:hypothetical protein [Rhizobiaceae bacterium]
MTRLIILESNISVKGGHYQTTPLAISKTYPKYEHHLLCDGALPMAYRGSIRSVNTSLARVEWKSVNDPNTTLFKTMTIHTRRILGLRKSFAEVMRAYFQTLKITRDDHLLVPSCSKRLMRSVIQLLQAAAGAEFPTIHIRCIAESEPFDYMEEFGVDTLRALIDQKRLFLYTETQAHSAILLQQYGIRASNTLIVPCNVYPDMERPDASCAVSDSRGPLTVGVLGGPRRDKGSDRIAPIVEALRALLATDSETTQVDVMVQVSAASAAQENHICNRLHNLPACRNGVNLRFLETGISRDEYVRQLFACDVLLLPYLAEKRRYQGSGIILDAVFAKRPLIHTKGIAFEEYLDHGNAMEAVSDAEFAQRIYALGRDRGALLEGAERAYGFARQKIQNPPVLENAR